MGKLRPALRIIMLLAYGLLFPASIYAMRPIILASPVLADAAVQPDQPAQPFFPVLPTRNPQPLRASTTPAQTALPRPLATPTPMPVKAAVPPPAPPAPTATAPSPTQVPRDEVLPIPAKICQTLQVAPCALQGAIPLPFAPDGYRWTLLDGRYSFSAYAHPSDDYFLGDMVDIPGIGGVKAKEGFLFGVDGIGMQGGGYVMGMNKHNKIVSMYIRYIAGEWKLDGQNVLISDQWRYKESGEQVELSRIGEIRLGDARFAIAEPPDLTPYYSVAASPRFAIGTKLFVPGLQQFGGQFEVQDRGGAFDINSQRFDIYVGQEMSEALKFIRLGPARSDLEVYVLEPIRH